MNFGSLVEGVRDEDVLGVAALVDTLYEGDDPESVKARSKYRSKILNRASRLRKLPDEKKIHEDPPSGSEKSIEMIVSESVANACLGTKPAPQKQIKNEETIMPVSIEETPLADPYLDFCGTSRSKGKDEKSVSTAPARLGKKDGKKHRSKKDKKHEEQPVEGGSAESPEKPDSSQEVGATQPDWAVPDVMKDAAKKLFLIGEEGDSLNSVEVVAPPRMVKKEKSKKSKTKGKKKVKGAHDELTESLCKELIDEVVTEAQKEQQSSSIFEGWIRTGGGGGGDNTNDAAAAAGAAPSAAAGKKASSANQSIVTNAGSSRSPPPPKPGFYPACLRPIVPQESALFWTSINNFLAIAGCLLLLNIIHINEHADPNYPAEVTLFERTLFMVWEFMTCIVWIVQVILSATYEHFKLRQGLSWYTRLEIVAAVYFLATTVWMCWFWKMMDYNTMDLWEIGLDTIWFVFLSIRGCYELPPCTNTCARVKLDKAVISPKDLEEGTEDGSSYWIMKSDADKPEKPKNSGWFGSWGSDVDEPEKPMKSEVDKPEPEKPKTSGWFGWGSDVDKPEDVSKPQDVEKPEPESEPESEAEPEKPKKSGWFV